MRESAVFVWVLRGVWLTLPLSAGNAVSDALDGWSPGSRVVAALLLWTTWAVGVVAVLAPRPLGLTFVRTASPWLVAVAVATVIGERASSGAAALAIGATTAAWVLAATPDFGRACADGIAYGDERRFPLKVPPALFLGPLPLAVALVGAGLAAGPLLLGDERFVGGAVALVVGVPVALLVARAVHGLSRRWAVLVPAGIVVADPFTLADPVLVTRARIARLALHSGAPPPGDALDLRLGAVARSVTMTLTDEAEVTLAGRFGRGGTAARAHALLFSPVTPEQLLLLASERRLPVR